jgi:hypothetical protein
VGGCKVKEGAIRAVKAGRNGSWVVLRAHGEGREVVGMQKTIVVVTMCCLRRQPLLTGALQRGQEEGQVAGRHVQRYASIDWLHLTQASARGT